MNFITKLLRKIFIKTEKSPPVFGKYTTLVSKNCTTFGRERLASKLHNGVLNIYSGPIPKRNLTPKNRLLATGSGVSLSLRGKAIMLDKLLTVNIVNTGEPTFVVLAPKSLKLPRVIIPIHGSKYDRVQFSMNAATLNDIIHVTRLEL